MKLKLTVVNDSWLIRNIIQSIYPKYNKASTNKQLIIKKCKIDIRIIKQKRGVRIPKKDWLAEILLRI